MTTSSQTARAVLDALDTGRRLPPFTEADPGFGMEEAGAAAVDLMRLREARGERVAGHKLGFTNRTIWAEYGVYAPIWGPVYESTVRPLGLPFALSPLHEPRIEPEIVFRLAGAPEPDMTGDELLACVSHVALGFEIVQSVFPGWRFRAPDTVAAAALHGALLHGPFVAIGRGERGDWAARLADFGATLLREGAVADEGRSVNVLGGGPVAALAHLAEVLRGLPGAPGMAETQVFTTGTLTRALPVAPGESWEVRVQGLALDPVRIDFA
jgi:2-oxo-3-hexenedioate decarboxylase